MMNPRSVSLQLIALLLLLPSLCSAGAKIDVLVVFSSDVSLSTLEKSQVAGRYQTALTSVYETQLENNGTIEVHVLLAPSMSYTAANKLPRESIRWMRSQNANPSSDLRIARDQLGDGGSDLVIMVVPDFLDSPGGPDVCGTTDPEDGSHSPPRTVRVSNSESYAFAAVILEENDPDCEEDHLIPHEIGHLLYAEHEFDTNGDELLPSYSNHATDNAAGNVESLMWHANTDFGSEWLSGSLASLTSGFADNVEFMSTSSFDVVSLYRRPIPKPTVGVIPMGCDGQSCNNYEIVFGGSPHPQSYQVQRALGPNGPWFNHSISMTGDHRGIVHSTEWQTTYWRARVTLGNGNSEWSNVHNAADQCDVDDDCPFDGFCGPFY